MELRPGVAAHSLVHPALQLLAAAHNLTELLLCVDRIIILVNVYGLALSTKSPSLLASGVWIALWLILQLHLEATIVQTSEDC